MHDLWAELEPADAQALLARGVMRDFRRGQALLHERQLPDRVLVIRSGRVKITVSSPAGREVVLAFRGPGELVGELSALDEQPRSATAVALERVEALAIAHGDFRAFLAERPAASLALLRILARRLRDADAKRLESASASTLERVASRLLELCDRFGEPDGECTEIDLPLSQVELAGWAGASLESVGRALQTMRGLGWIETRRRQLRVVDVDALRRAAA
jgi:CRP/FNR family transcriptional regulator, cyclic AMP receptor protein